MEIWEQLKCPRTQVSVVEGDHSGHRITLTRAGVEIDGWFDSIVGTGDRIHLSWEEFDALRERVFRKRVKNSLDPKEVRLKFGANGIEPCD